MAQMPEPEPPDEYEETREVYDTGPAEGRREYRREEQIGPTEEQRVSRIPPGEEPVAGPTPVERGPGYSETVAEDVNAERRLRIAKATQLVYIAFGILEGLIAIRILLMLIGANPTNPFTAFIYNFTGVFLWPFAGLVTNPSAGGVTFEITSIIGLIVYALIAWAAVRLMWVLLAPTSTRTVSRYDRYNR